MQDGFVKIAAATPDLRVADCAYNASEIIKQAKQAAEKGAHLIVFPELCLTGYTCGDLFLQQTLLSGALSALETVCREMCIRDSFGTPAWNMPACSSSRRLRWGSCGRRRCAQKWRACARRLSWHMRKARHPAREARTTGFCWSC